MEGYGVTFPLHALAQQGAFRALKDLLAPLDEQCRKATLNARDHRGFTVLHKAMEAGDPETVSYLLANGADVTARVTGSDPEGWTALHLAAFDNHPAIIELLVRHGAELDPAPTDSLPGRMTPLRVAITKNRIGAAKTLIQLGANVHDQAQGSFTLLHEACNCGLAPVANVLLDKGAEVDAVASDHSTPLCWAARNNDVGMVALLLRRGADPNYQGPGGESPLAAATMFGATEAAQVLVEAGARQ